jgi:integrase
MAKRRHSGSIRRLRSGRLQARVKDPMTNKLVAIGTYATKGEADRAIAVAQADQLRAAWVDPRRGRLTLHDYGERWLAGRTDLRPRTHETYEGLLRLHITPWLGDVEIGKLATSAVRSWNALLLGDDGPGQVTTAKAYRLLRTILNTAVADELIVRNPCTIKGAGIERSPERPIATVAQVYEIADRMPDRFRFLVLLAAFSSLRIGELQGLRRRNLDLLHRTLTVAQQVQQLRDGTLDVGAPKTDAGYRTIELPARLVPDAEHHLAHHAGVGVDGYVFCNGDQPFSRMAFYRAWKAAVEAVGLPELNCHDLRHTGNMLAAATPGVTTKDLMARMGQDSPAAALRYQHATRERATAIAHTLDDAIANAQRDPLADVVAL